MSVLGDTLDPNANNFISTDTANPILRVKVVCHSLHRAGQICAVFFLTWISTLTSNKKLILALELIGIKNVTPKPEISLMKPIK